MITYRVEKDHLSFYILPPKIVYYYNEGWAVYRVTNGVETLVTDPATEMEEAIARTQLNL